MGIKVLLTAIAILLGIIAFTSCSIQERRYMPGYDVNWLKKTDERKEPVESAAESMDAKKEKKAKIISPDYKKQDTVIEKTVAQAESNAQQVQKAKSFRPFYYSTVPVFTTIKELQPSITKNKRVTIQQLQSIGLLLAILGVALIVIAIIIALDSLFSPTPLIADILVVFGIVFLIIGFIISVIALIKAKRSTTYETRWKAIAGIIISIIGLLPFVLGIIALALSL